MKKEIAEIVNLIMLDCVARLDVSIHVVKNNCDEKTFVAYRKAIGQIMGSIYCDIMMPIHKKYKTLKSKRYQPSSRDEKVFRKWQKGKL